MKDEDFFLIKKIRLLHLGESWCVDKRERRESFTLAPWGRERRKKRRKGKEEEKIKL